MAKNFILTDRTQQLLMPPDLREWLPSDHLVWFVIDAVSQIDLSQFYAQHRDDGWGRAAYEPRMMVTLLLYAYSIGVRSAREIERRCQDDVAFRVITSNHRIDHATICRFRTRHRQALSELFVDVLGLCAEAEMVSPQIVAIDGTKVAANASGSRNVTRKQLEEFARQVFDEAERIDAEEDELFGDRRGDQIPDHLVDQAERIEWLKRKLAERQKTLARPNRKDHSGRKSRINTTDPDSAVQKTPQGFIQGYSGQLAVTPDQVIVAADLTSDNNDSAQLDPMLAQAKENLEATDQAEIQTVVADNSYFTNDAVSGKFGVDLLVAPVGRRKLEEAVANRSSPIKVDDGETQRWERRVTAARRRDRRRKQIVAAFAAKLVTRTEAAQELGVSLNTVTWLSWVFRNFRTIPPTKLPPAPPRPSGTDVMLERFARPGALSTYALRARTIEPVFGQIKEARGMRRFLHRGLSACRCEWRMMASAHNLRKLWVRSQFQLVPSVA